MAQSLAPLDWFDLRQMLVVAGAVRAAALARNENRGAHQREDFPEMAPARERHQVQKLPA